VGKVKRVHIRPIRPGVVVWGGGGEG
jgi:hypothetical protein